MTLPLRCLLSCEHGGNRIPKEYAHLFEGHQEMLATHRGLDIGILPLARQLADTLGAPLVEAQVSRLLVDLNRSPGSSSLFSPMTVSLSPAKKTEVLSRYYHPYREAVIEKAAGIIGQGHRVVHLSVHSFTPVLRGEVRNADIGLLYDPARPLEQDFCRRWKTALSRLAPALRVRCNYPYKGASDSLVRTLRRRFVTESYLGLELEVNQALPQAETEVWMGVSRALCRSLEELLLPSSQN